MPESTRKADWWRLLVFPLWVLYFLVGLVPEVVFGALRDWGEVPTQRALVNSPFAITVALSIYLALFVYRRCRAVGLGAGASNTRAIQVGILGLAAFLGVPQPVGASTMVSLLGMLAMYRSILEPSGQIAVLVAGITKIAVWWYLFSLIVRYHVFKNDRVFADMPSLFPSGHLTSRAENASGTVADESDHVDRARAGSTALPSDEEACAKQE